MFLAQFDVAATFRLPEMTEKRVVRHSVYPLSIGANADVFYPSAFSIITFNLYT
jgi:hypothetical protein